MKLSFDFDSTLDREDVQEFAKLLVDSGHEVWITTSRFDTKTALEKGWWWIEKNNHSLYKVAEVCGISKENIAFTTMFDKIKFLQGKDFLFHLDDDVLELEMIEESDDNCIGVLVESEDWREVCENILKQNK
jgi:restriction endonuclease Mrr